MLFRCILIIRRNNSSSLIILAENAVIKAVPHRRNIMIKVAMFDTKPYDREYFEKAADGEMTIDYFETKLEPSTVVLAKNYDAVVVFVNDVLDKTVIKSLKRYGVKLVALRCAGFNNVDVKYAKGRVRISRVPAYSPYSVAEFTMALLLTSIRRVHKAFNRTREYNFSINGLTGTDLHSKTVGVIGAGKIGRTFIDICNGFSMKVLAYDKYPDLSVNAEFVSLDELINRSDIISLHCPLTKENEHFIDAEVISRMKNGAIIINTSRGALIDSEALVEGLLNKKIGAACLDVYEEESDFFFEDKSNHIMADETLARLLSMPNVILTSHQAFLTDNALENIASTTVNNITRFFKDGVCENEVVYNPNSD